MQSLFYHYTDQSVRKRLEVVSPYRPQGLPVTSRETCRKRSVKRGYNGYLYEFACADFSKLSGIFAAAALLTFAAGAVHAKNFPTKPIRFVILFAASHFANYGLLALEPVDCCGEAEHAHEG
jgi:hypothetical protein